MRARPASCARSTTSRCSCSPRPRTSCTRGASVASPTMPWVWGTLTLEDSQTLRPVPPRLAARPLPRRDRPEGRRRRRRRRPAARLPVAASRSPTARSGRTPRSTARSTGRASSSTRPRCRSCSRGGWAAAARRTGRTCARAADYLVANGPDSDQERWENQNGWSPNTIATEIAGLICAADIARRNGDTARAATLRGHRRRVAAQRPGVDGDDQRPVLARSPTTCASRKDGNPNDGSTYDLGDNHVDMVDEREIVDQSFLGLVLFGAKPLERPDDPQLAHGRPTRLLPRADAERPGLAPLHVRRLRRDARPARDWDIFPTKAQPDVRARCGRC